MAVQRDQNNTYYVDFKVKDSSGTWRHICKRGFKTLKDAKKWEAEYRKNPPVKSEQTLKTYTHLLASSDQQMMDKINSYREGNLREKIPQGENLEKASKSPNSAYLSQNQEEEKREQYSIKDSPHPLQ